MIRGKLQQKLAESQQDIKLRPQQENKLEMVFLIKKKLL